MLQRWQHTCAGNVRGVFVVLQKWQNRVREMCGEICCVQKVAKTCAGNVRGNLLCSKDAKNTCAGTVRVNLLCFKVATHMCGKCAGRFAVFERWQKRVREMCGEFCCAPKMAKTCAGNVRGILLCSKVAKHVCGKCAGIFGVFKGWQTNECWTCADHENLHTVAILAQDACCCIWLAPDGRHWLRAKFAAVCLSWCQRRSGRQRRSGG